LATVLSRRSSPGVFQRNQETLAKLAGDFIRMEQYLDFLRNRAFRRTILCRREVAIRRELDAADITKLSLASEMKR